MIKNPQEGDAPSILSAPRPGSVETLETLYTWVACRDVSGDRASQEMDERVHKAVQFMESNCQHKLRLQQIAAGIGMSRSRFSALIISHFGVSPMRLLKTIRMQQARALLQSSTLNVKEIAAHAGFNDVSHFVRDFSRLYGKSPKTIRNRK